MNVFTFYIFIESSPLRISITFPSQNSINRKPLSSFLLSYKKIKINYVSNLLYQFRYVITFINRTMHIIFYFKNQMIKSLDLFTLSLYNERKPSKRVDGFQNGILFLRFTVRTEFAHFTNNSCFDSVAARSDKFTRIVNFLVFV